MPRIALNTQLFSYLKITTLRERNDSMDEFVAFTMFQNGVIFTAKRNHFFA